MEHLTLDKLMKDFQTIGLKEDVKICVLIYKHILTRPTLEEDFIHLWHK